MREKSNEVKSYRVVYTRECGSEMKFSGVMYPVSPPKYLHICEKFKTEARLPEKYPVIRFE